MHAGFSLGASEAETGGAEGSIKMRRRGAAVGCGGSEVTIVTSVRSLAGHSHAACKSPDFNEKNFPDRRRPFGGGLLQHGGRRMSPIIAMLQVARDHPAETVAFTILFGWSWHAVVRLDRGRQRLR